MTMKDKIQIYTDGAAKGNPGPAGWGAVARVEARRGDTPLADPGRVHRNPRNVVAGASAGGEAV